MAFPPNTPKASLNQGFLTLALCMQEMATYLSNDDVATRLRKALKAQNDDYWCYLISFFGDDSSGTVVYSCDSEIKQAPYTCSPSGAKIDVSQASSVLPVTTYVLATESAIREAGRRNSAADLKQLQTIHDHAVTLGAACSVKEGAASDTTGNIKLVESADWRETATLDLIEAAGGGSEMEIKLIAPGKGSSAFYTAEVLKRDADKFKKNTQVYINHATDAEEAARPEGDWHKLAGALSTDAYWKESGKYGAGLYAKALFSSDYAGLIREKAPFTGMSIRANGAAVVEGKKPVMREGVPLLDRFTHVESVDVVTKAGAGGMILTESAKPGSNPNDGGDPRVDATQFTKLQETVTQQGAALVASTAANAKLLERALRGDAREEAARILKGVSLVEAAKTRVIDAVTRDFSAIPKTEAGELDPVKFKEAVDLAAKAEGEYVASITGSGRVNGLGAPAPVVPIDTKEAERRAADSKKLRETAVRNFIEMGMVKEAAEAAADRLVQGEVA